MSKFIESDRSQKNLEFFDSIANERDFWIERNRYFYEEDWKYSRFLIPEGHCVLEVGCGTGQLLNALNPIKGVGIDFSQAMVEQARTNFPQFEFYHFDAMVSDGYKKINGPFDYIIISDSIGLFCDCFAVLDALHQVCTAKTRIIVSYYNFFWDPILRLGTNLGARMPQVEGNYLSSRDIKNILDLADFEVVATESRLLLPKRLGGIATLFNKYVATLPLIRNVSLRNYVTARPARDLEEPGLSCTILIPCRNEKGNIETAIQRLPKFCDDIEVIFVEGHSQDGTFEECKRVQKSYPDWNIKVMQQPGKGKGDAVQAGFLDAEGDVLMILDADLTVPPEDLPKFYRAIIDGKGEFINGSRLVYPMENQAMRFLNLCANWVFARIFSYLLNQRYTDTLCGTKVIRKHHYQMIIKNRSFFGDFDPFGDFDLIFGAAKLGLKVAEIPIRYASRSYGETQISRFSHGWLLLKMVVFAFRKLKAI